jgi:hypothetical protein
MAEIELNVMIRQCLNGRFDSLDKAANAIAAWQRHRDNLEAKVYWQFTTQDAGIKHRRLYLTLET